MPSLTRKEENACKHGGSQTTKNNIVRHKKSCSAGKLYCTHSPHFSTISQSDLNYHRVKKTQPPKPVGNFKCKLFYQDLRDFYALPQPKSTQNGFPLKRATVDPDDNIKKVDDANLEEELRSCQHFVMDYELERARHKVFNYAVEPLNERIVNENFGHFSTI